MCSVSALLYELCTYTSLLMLILIFIQSESKLLSTEIKRGGGGGGKAVLECMWCWHFRQWGNTQCPQPWSPLSCPWLLQGQQGAAVPPSRSVWGGSRVRIAAGSQMAGIWPVPPAPGLSASLWASSEAWPSCPQWHCCFCQAPVVCGMGPVGTQELLPCPGTDFL